MNGHLGSMNKEMVKIQLLELKIEDQLSEQDFLRLMKIIILKGQILQQLGLFLDRDLVDPDLLQA